MLAQTIGLHHLYSEDETFYAGYWVRSESGAVVEEREVPRDEFDELVQAYSNNLKYAEAGWMEYTWPDYDWEAERDYEQTVHDASLYAQGAM